MVAAALLGTAPIAKAAILYWDSNGTTVGAGTTPTGNWLTSNFWGSSLDGTTSTGAWTDGNDAVFSAGTDATGASTITITAGSNVSAVSLTFEEGTVTVGGSTNNNLTLTGTGNITVNSGSFAEIGNGTTMNLAGTVGITKLGAGTLSLRPWDAMTFTGGVRLNSGRLLVDFSSFNATPTNIVVNTNVLTLGGGILEVKAKNNAATTQAFASTTVATGDSGVTGTVQGTGTPAIDLKAITRNVGGVVNFVNPTGTLSAANSIRTSTGTASSLLTDSGVAYATVSGNDWAAKDSTNAWIVGLSSLGTNYTNSTTTTLAGNADVATGVNTTLSANSAITTLRFNLAEARRITLNSGVVLTTGGLLVTSAVGANLSTITGGSLRSAATAANRDLVIINNNTSGALSISSVIADATAGATGLTKSGGGTLTLSGANTYTGVTTLSAGRLELTKNTSLYNATTASWTAANIKIAGGTTLALNVGGTGEFTTGNVTTLLANLGGANGGTSGGFAAGTSIVFDTTNASGGAFTVSDNIVNSTGVGGGSLAVSKLGTNTLSISGANSYTGLTTVSAGTLALGSSGSNNAIPGGGLTIGGANNTAATVQYTGSSTDMMGTGAVTINGRGALDFNGKTDSIGNVSIVSTGATADSTPILNTAGNGNLSIGSLSITPVAGFTSRINSSNGTITLGGNLTLTAATTGQAQISGNIDLGGTSRTFTVGLGTATSHDLLVDAVVSSAGGAFGLTKAGTGRLTLSAVNTFSGGVTINAGTLNINNPAALGDAAGTFMIGGGTVDNTSGTAITNSNNNPINLSGNFTFTGTRDLNLGIGPISLGAAAGTARTITTTAGVLTLGGNMSDGTTATGITKAGAGTLMLSGANAYTGLTTVNAGTLTIASTSALPGWDISGRYSVANGATLAVYNAITDANVGSMLTTTNFAAGATLGFDTTSGNRSYGAALADTAQGALNLAKIGANTLTLTGANSYTGTTSIRAGGLSLLSGTSLAHAGSDLTLGSASSRLDIAAGASISFRRMTSVNGSQVNIAGNWTGNAAQGVAHNQVAGTYTQTAGAGTLLGLVTGNAAGDLTSFYLGGNSTLSVGRGQYASVQIGARGTADFAVSGSAALTVTGDANPAANNANQLIVGNNSTFSAPTAGTSRLIQQSGIVTANGVQLGGGTGTSTNGIYYLNGGSLTTSTLTRGSNAASTGTLYFGGGTFRSGTAFSTDASILTTINSGGATIDTTSGDLTWSGNITAGNTGTVTGVTGLAGGTGYTPGQFALTFSAPPSGTTATGYAVVDLSGTVTDVVITNPGNGYTAAPTITGWNTGGASATAVVSTTTGGLVKSGNGVLTLSGANTYAGGTTVNAGRLQLGSDNVGTVGAISSGPLGTGTLVLSGGELSSNSATARTVLNPVTFTADTALGAELISTGKLTFSGGVDFGSTSRTLTVRNETQFDGAVTASGGIIKSGVGTLILTGAQNYSGSTQVNAGLLQVTGTLAGSTVTVSGTGALGGTGTISSPVTIGNGGLLAPATATTTGKITFSSLTLAAGSALALELGVVARDQIEITTAGGLTIDGGALSLYADGGVNALTTNGTYTLFTYSGSFAGSLNNLSVANSAPGKAYSVADVSGTIALTIGTATTSAWTAGAGDGVWGTVGNWDNTIPPATFGSVASFGAGPLTASVITLDGSKTVGSIIFDNANGYTLTGGLTDAVILDNGIAAGAIGIVSGNHAINVPITLNGAAAFTTATGTTLSIGGAITGARSVTYAGSGTTLLTGDNTYSGATTVSGGILQLGNGGTFGSLSASSNLANNSQVAFRRTDTLTQGADFPSVISGTGSVSHLGSGVLVLNGSNTYSGGTSVTGGGTLSINSLSSLGAVSGALTFSGSGGTLRLDANVTGATRNYILNAATTINTNGFSLSTSGALSGTSSLTKSGNGTLTLSSANTYAGTTTVNAGTLRAGNATSFGPAASATLAFGAGSTGTVQLGGNAITVIGLDTNITPGSTIVENASAAGGVLTVNNTANNRFEGILQDGTGGGTLGLTKNGAGTLTLAGSNTLTGTINISGGTLIAANPAALGAAGRTIGLGTATLEFATDTSTNAYVFNLGSSNTFVMTLNRATSGETITHRQGASLLGNSTLTVQKGSNVTGTPTLEIDSLSLTAGVAGQGQATLNATTARIAVLGGITRAGNNATLLVLSGPMTGNTVGGVIANRNATDLLAVTKTGTGSWDLQGANTYTGVTTVREGTLTLSGNRTANMVGKIVVGDAGAVNPVLDIKGDLPMAASSIEVATSAGVSATVNQIAGLVSFATGSTGLFVGYGGASGTYNLSGGTISTPSSTTRGVAIGSTDGAAGSLRAGVFRLSGTGTLDNALGVLQVVRGDFACSYLDATYEQTAGTSSNGILLIGGNAAIGANSVATFTVTGGTFSATTFSNLSRGNNVSSTLTIGGTADVTLPAFPTTRGTSSTATLNFDGGTLKPSASSAAYLGGLTNAFVKAGGAKFDTNSFDITVSQALLADPASAGGGLTKAGNGTLTLTGANTFTGGLSIEAGTLVLGNANALNPTAGSENAVAFGASSTGTLRLNGNSIVVANLSSNVAPGTPAVENGSATNITLTVGNSANLSGTFAGVVRNGPGAGILGLTKVGNGTLTLSGANTYSGTTTVTAGILRAGAANAFSPNSAINLANASGVSLDLAGYSQTLNSLDGGGATGGNISLGSSGVLTVGSNSSFDGGISGSGTSGLTKTGDGAFTLGATGTITGTASISVNQGTFVLNGTTGTNVSANVAAAATFRGTGVFGGDLTIADGGILQAGNAGTGILTVNQLTFAGASSLTFASTGSNPTNSIVTTTLTTTGFESILLNVTGVPPGGWTSGTYDLISYTTLNGTGRTAFKLGTIEGRALRTDVALDNQPNKISFTITNAIAKWTGGTNAFWNNGSTPLSGNWSFSSNQAQAYFIDGDAVLFDDSASSYYIDVVGIIAPSSVVFDNSQTYTLSSYEGSGISGSTGLTKRGGGRLIVETWNTYSGDTIIEAGTLKLGVPSLVPKLSAQTAALSLRGGALDLNGNTQTVGAITITAASAIGETIRNGTITGSSYVFSNTSGDAVISAILGGDSSVGLTKNGAGSATLSAANTYGGATTVNAGTLTVTSSGSLGATSAINLAGGSLQLSSGVTLPNAVPLTFTGGSLDLGTSTQAVGAVSVANAAASGATIANGSLTGASYAVSNATGDAVINASLLANSAIGFTKTGNGRVTLGGANTYTGATTVSAGTLAAGSSSAFTGLNSLDISGTSTFDLNGFNATFSGNVINAPATVTITDSSAGSGTSTLTFRQTNVSTAARITDGSTRKVALAFTNNNGTQQFTNALNTFSGGLTLLHGATNGTRLHVATAPANTIVSGVLTAGPYGTGPITLGQIATDRAGIYVSAATTTIANDIVFNTGLGTDLPGFRYDSTGNFLSGTITANNAAATFSTYGTGAVTLSGRVTGANGLTLDNAFGTTITVTLNNATGVANDYQGETRIAGTKGILVLGAADQIPNGASAGNLNASGTFRLQGFNETINGLTGTGTVTTTVAGASVLTLGDNNATASFSGTITESVGTVRLVKIGTGTQTLTNTMTYTGGTTVAGGTLALGHLSNTLADTGAVTVNGGTLSLGTNSETVGTVTLSSGTISGTTGVLTSTANYDLRGGTVAAILGGAVGANKTTAGTTTVTSVVAYTGATSVTNGTLRLSGAGDLNSTSGITVNGAGAKFFQSSSVAVSKAITLTQGTVTGSGTINTVNVGAGANGVISNNDGVGGAGLTVGSLSVDGSVNLSAFSDGTASIPLTITSLTNNGNVTITANNASGWINGTTYDLLTYGSATGTNSNSFTYAANNKSARQTESWNIVNSVVKLTINGTKPYWTGGTDNKWNTSATGNWKRLDDNTDTVFLPTDDVLFNDNASGTGAITVDIDAANVLTSLTLFENATRHYMLTGAFGISAGSLTKTGAGRLTVTNVNTYQGTTSINGGTVVLTGAGTLGSGAPLVMGGGSLDLDAASKAFGTVSVTAPAGSGFTIGNGSLTGTSYAASNASGTAVISADLLANGSAGFTKTGAGAVTLSGANTFTGGFTLSAGTVNVGSAGALGAGAVILSGGALDGVVGSPATVANGLTINGDFAFVGSSDLTISGASTLGTAAGSARVITVNASNLSLGAIANGSTANTLNKAGLGTLVLSGANTYTGVTNVQNGTLRLTGSLPAASTLVLGNNTNSGKFALGSAAAAVNQTLAGISVAGTGTSNAIVGGHTSVSTLTLSHTAEVTYAGTLGGAGTNENNLELIKSGTGTLILSGNSTYDGLTTLSTGVLNIRSAGALGSTARGTIVNGAGGSATNARLELEGGVTISGEALTINGAGNFTGALNSKSGSNVWAGNVTLGSVGTRIGSEAGATLTISGVIDSAGQSTGLIVRSSSTGVGVVVLSGANTYLGDTQVVIGTLRLDSGDNRLPIGTRLTLGNTTSTTQFDLNGRNQEIAGLSLNANVTTADNSVNNSSTTLSSLTINTATGNASSFGGVIRGNLALVKSGADQLTLSGTNTYTGATTVTGGTLALSGASNNNIASSSGISLGNGTTLSVAGLTGGTLILASGQSLTATGATATVTGTALNTSGNNTLSTTGGTLTLPRLNVFGTGNQFTGGNLSSGGTNRGLVIGSSTGAGELTISGGSFSTAGAQLADVIGNDQNGSLTVNGGTFAGAATTVLGLNSGLSWTSTLTVSGTGAVNVNLLQLSAANSVVNLDGGTLTAQQIVDLDNQGVAGASNTTFNFNGGLLRAAAGANATFLSGLTNAFVKAGGARIDTNGQNIAIGQALFADPVSTGGGLTKSGNGTLTLTGANTYTGATTVNGGTLRVASLGTTGASSVGSSDRAVAANLALNGPVRLEYAGTGETTSRSFTVSGTGLTLASSGSGAIDVTSSANVAFADAGASTRELRLAGSNTGDNTYAASAAGTPAAADRFSRIVKNEVGKWIIAGSGNTFADNLQVEVNGGLLAFTGTRLGAAVTVNNGGTLGGSASLGAVSVNNGGALSPGASPGVFTSSSLTLAGGSIIHWQVLDGLGSAGIGYDQLAVTGNLDLRGASATNKIIIKISSVTAQDVNGEPLNFGAPNGVSSIRSFHFGQVGGLLQTNGENISDLFRFDVSDFDYTGRAASNAGLWSISWNADNGAITLTAVPEPSTYGLGLGALALAAAALRRRRRRLAPKA